MTATPGVILLTTMTNFPISGWTLEMFHPIARAMMMRRIHNMDQFWFTNERGFQRRKCGKSGYKVTVNATFAGNLGNSMSEAARAGT
jgi:hypothetical protein